jgi:aminopeptidase N
MMTTMTTKKPTSERPARLISVAFILLLSACGVSAQRRERVVDTWRPLHYDVNLTFDDQLSQLASARTDIKVEVLAPSIDKVDLDFGEMPVDSVLVGGTTAKFERTSERLNVLLPAAAARGNKLDITVNYHGRPKYGLVFDKDADGKPSATGDNWPDRVHYWIPSLDHPSAKATVSFNIAAPQRFEVIANGEFIRLIGNAAVSHWTFNEAKAIPPYCMIVAVNEGAIINSPDKEVTNLLYNVPHRDAEYAPKGFSPAAPALAFYSQTVAPYPYEKLALIVGATQFGGMENSSAIVFPSNVFGQRSTEAGATPGRSTAISRRFGIPTRIESVVAHEIAHQWFGDSVTESTWADLWLSEGFATYFAGLFIEKYDGEDAFRDYMRDAAKRYFNFEKQASFPIHDTETPKLMSLLNPNNYEKGAWVLHMLRSQLGDKAFFEGLRDYYNSHKEANASTEDLRSALEKSSGKDLKGFFARWVYGSGHPIYRVERVALGAGGNSMSAITLRQVQPGEAFLDPVTLEITTADGRKLRQTITPKSKSESAQIGVNLAVKDIQIDPDDNLLKEVVK